MNIDFQPISSSGHSEDILAIAELISLFTGECFIADLEWDEDQLLASFIQSIDDPNTRADFEVERTAGIQAAKDVAIAGLFELIVRRHGALGADSPFEWDFGEQLLLRRKSNLTPVGLSYVWLSLFWLLSSPNQYLVLTPDSTTFLSAFDDVFEATCAFVLAGRRESATWYLGNSRSARELLTRLTRVSQFCGSGQAKAYAQLTRSQRHSNDGGVDVLAVTTINGAVMPDSEIYLVGATIQRTNRRGKIIGGDQITRFRNYFLQPVNPPMTGVLAVPFEHSELDAEKCAEQNCMYVSKLDILNYLGRHSRVYGTSHLRRAGGKILKETKAFVNGVTFRN